MRREAQMKGHIRLAVGGGSAVVVTLAQDPLPLVGDGGLVQESACVPLVQFLCRGPGLHGPVPEHG